MIKLNKWSIIKVPTEIEGFYSIHAAGIVSGHPNLEDGMDIRTSPVVSIDLETKTVKTLNSEYHLGEEKNPEYASAVY